VEIVDRIIERGVVDPKKLTPNPKNWRTHSDRQKLALEGVMEEIGFIQQVVVNRRTGHIVDGHLRVKTAIEAGMKEIPVGYVDLSEEEEALALATFDPLGALAGTDAEILDSLLRGVDTDNKAVAGLLAETAKQAGLVDFMTEPKAKKGREKKEEEKYELKFDDEDDKATFFEFVKLLRRRYPSIESIAGRLAVYIREYGLDNLSD
jgi:hypothetical protein